mgnify:FL=1
MKKGGGNASFFRDKTGQITIFIIVAIVIVAMAVLIYVFYPQISSTLGVGEQDPNAFIQTCMEDEIKSTVETISLQGGSLEPESYFTYNNIPIQYLCYINEANKLCVVQQPLLKQHIESEMKAGIEPVARNCFDELKTSFEGRNYDVIMREGDINVELLPQRIVSTFNYTVTLERAGETKRYESFNVVLNNNLYELESIGKSIIEWEATVGKADPRTYMSYYPNLKVEKNVRDDGTNIYILTDRSTGDKFQFAIRSLVSAPGF